MNSKTMKKMIVYILAMSTLGSTMLTGCGEKKPAAATEAPAATATPVAAATETPKVDAADPLAKYPEPVTITVGRRTFGTDPIDEFWKETLLKDYNINVEIAMEADASQFDNKVNVAIASGNIPDVLQVSPQNMDTLVKADMAMDITELLEKNVSPLNREYLLEGVGGEALKSVTYDGKVRFIPLNVSSFVNNAFPLFIRKDWMENLGLQPPKTMDDFKKMAVAFSKNDPDKNGKNDTYGLAVAGQANLLEDWGGLFGFFSGYGAQPCLWYDGMLFYSKDDKGNVVWDGTKPEVKEGLQLLADLYKEGAIAKDFPTMDISKVSEDLNGGKAGMVFGVRGLPYWAIQNTIKNDPKADWYAMNMPTKDGSVPPIFTYQPVNTGYVISSKCKNPEAVIKMMNVYTALVDPKSPLYNPRTIEEPVRRGAFVTAYDPYKEVNDHKAVFEAIKTKDKSKLNADGQIMYDEAMAYQDTKDPKFWSRWNAIYPEAGHAFYLVFGQNDESMLKKNEWWALPSENMLAKLPVYKKLAEETMTKIVAGAVPVTEWDNMVAQWNKLGGEEVTKEVLDSLK
ncbi:MAG: hypothetical protein AB9856_18345 [Cellulosilyticaceae bacterium]